MDTNIRNFLIVLGTFIAIVIGANIVSRARADEACAVPMTELVARAKENLGDSQILKVESDKMKAMAYLRAIEQVLDQKAPFDELDEYLTVEDVNTEMVDVVFAKEGCALTRIRFPATMNELFIQMRDKSLVKEDEK